MSLPHHITTVFLTLLCTTPTITSATKPPTPCERNIVECLAEDGDSILITTRTQRNNRPFLARLTTDDAVIIEPNHLRNVKIVGLAPHRLSELMFRNLPCVEYLDLAHNRNITTFTKGVFINDALPSLQHVDVFNTSLDARTQQEWLDVMRALNERRHHVRHIHIGSVFVIVLTFISGVVAGGIVWQLRGMYRKRMAAKLERSQHRNTVLLDYEVPGQILPSVLQELRYTNYAAHPLID